MSQSPFARVLADFGSRLGLDGLAVDEQGAATLRVDDSFEFNLVESPDGQVVTAFVELGLLGEDLDDPDALRRILEANYFWKGTGGATLGLQPETGAAVLAERFAANTVTPELLESVLQRFIEFTERGLQNDEEDGEATSAAELSTVRV
jgi:hypothetical protein